MRAVTGEDVRFCSTHRPQAVKRLREIVEEEEANEK
jgi:hypothetical protein